MYCLHPYCLWYRAVQYIRLINTAHIRLYALFSPLPVMGSSDYTESMSRSTLSSAFGPEGWLKARRVPDAGSSNLSITLSPLSGSWMDRNEPWALVMSSECLAWWWCWCLINQELLSLYLYTLLKDKWSARG